MQTQAFPNLYYFKSNSKALTLLTARIPCWPLPWLHFLTGWYFLKDFLPYKLHYSESSQGPVKQTQTVLMWAWFFDASLNAFLLTLFVYTIYKIVYDVYRVKPVHNDSCGSGFLSTTANLNRSLESCYII